jgi:hypothetical protein
MAQADGVVANGTGSAVRSDINNQYAALWSNHSGSTEPSSGKVAYQFWADTNTSILKIRNSANNAWINLFTLAGGIDVDAASNFNEDVTFTGASYNLVWDKSDNALEFADNAKCTFGAGDLQIYHDATHNYIKNTHATAYTLIDAISNIKLRTNDTETGVEVHKNGSVEAYFDNVKKWETRNGGIGLFGHLEAGDNNKIMLGDSNDLTLYHDGTNSFITDDNLLVIRGDGLQLQRPNGNMYVKCIAGGAVEAYFDNVKRLETLSGGIQIHGDVTAWEIYNNTTSGGANVRVQSSGLLQRDTSSRRYKNSITDAVHGLADLKKLRSVTFKGNNDGDTIFGGLIAEEVHDAGLTEFVDYNDNNQPEALCYGNMVSLCIKAIQELAVEVETLKTKVAALEAK